MTTVYYPTSLTKYQGEVRPYCTQRGTRYEARITSCALYRSFDSECEAVDFICRENRERSLPVRNVMRQEPGVDHLLCQLNGGHTMKVDAVDMPLVERHLVYWDDGLCLTKCDGHKRLFAELLMPLSPVTNRKRMALCHINGDKSDLTRANLVWRRKVAAHGERGVIHRQSVLRTGTVQCRYVAQWHDPADGHLCSRSFGYPHGNEAAGEEARQRALAARRLALSL